VHQNHKKHTRVAWGIGKEAFRSQKSGYDIQEDNRSVKEKNMIKKEAGKERKQVSWGA